MRKRTKWFASENHRRFIGPSTVLGATLIILMSACTNTAGSGSGSSEPPTSNDAAATTTSTLPDSASTSPTGTADTRQLLESRLSYVVTLPGAWVLDSSPDADFWSDSYIGDDHEFFRARVYDYPNREPFVDSVPDVLPNLEEAVKETAGLFPSEFGTDPIIEPTTVDGRDGFLISPSPDSLAANAPHLHLRDPCRNAVEVH